MVKPAHALILRTLQTNGAFIAHLTRIQNGFMVESNLHHALKHIEDVQQELASLQIKLRTQTYSPPPYLTPMK